MKRDFRSYWNAVYSEFKIYRLQASRLFKAAKKNAEPKPKLLGKPTMRDSYDELGGRVSEAAVPMPYKLKLSTCKVYLKLVKRLKIR